MKKRWICMALCLSMAAALLKGCGQSGDIRLKEEKEEVSITFSWWGSDSRHEYTIEAIRAFEKLYPYIDVQLEYSEFTGFQQKTSVKMLAHTEADVMQINYAWVDLYSPDGTGFYDLNRLSGTLNLSNYTDASLGYGMSNGVLNALPIALNGKVFIYNKTIFDSYGLSVPESWEDLFAAAAVMKKDGVYPLDLDASGVWFVCVAYMEQVTGKPVIENRKFNFTQAEVQELLEFYMRLVDEGVVENLNERKEAKIKEGLYAGGFQWVTSAKSYSGNIEKAGGTVAYGASPVLSSASRSGWYVKPATMYAVSANTDHPEEAALLLEFLVSSEKMASEQQLDKGIPSNTAAKAVLEKNGMLTGPMYEANEIVDATETYLMSPYFENSGFSNALKNAYIDVLFGKATVEEAAAAAYAAMVDELK